MGKAIQRFDDLQKLLDGRDPKDLLSIAPCEGDALSIISMYGRAYPGAAVLLDYVKDAIAQRFVELVAHAHEMAEAAAVAEAKAEYDAASENLERFSAVKAAA